MDKRVTVKQVAEKAGVSVGTASNALRGVGRTAAETARRIRAVAERLGYSPDPAISVAMASIRKGTFSGHGEVIAFLTGFPGEEWRRRHIDRGYFDAGRIRAAELGFQLEPYWLDGKSSTMQRHSRILFSRGIRGVILAAFPAPESRVPLDWRHFAPVCISRSIAEPVTHRILDDHYAIMRLAMQQLMARGYRRIGFAMSRDRVERTRRLWLGAYLAYQLDLAPPDRISVFEPNFGREDRRFAGAFSTWFEEWQPDAIVGPDETDLEVIRSCGWRSPRDFGYASLALNPADDRFAGVIHNTSLVGRTAVSLVAGMLRSREFGLPPETHTTMIEGTWRDGPTAQPRGTPKLETRFRQVG